MRKRNEKDLGERKEISLPLQPVDIPWLVRKPPWRRELYLWYYPRSTLPPVPALGSSAQPLCCVSLVGEQMAMGGRRPAPGRGTQCWGFLGGGERGATVQGHTEREDGVRKWKQTAVREEMGMAAIFLLGTPCTGDFCRKSAFMSER